MIRYHEDIIGLWLSYRDEYRAVLSTQQGLECVVLEPGEGPELAGLCFKITPRISLEDARALLGKSGILAEIRKGRIPSLARVLAFKNSKGNGYRTVQLHRVRRCPHQRARNQCSETLATWRISCRLSKK